MSPQYIWHTTTTTGHHHKSMRDDVADDIIAIMQQWLANMREGQAQAVFDDKYACRIETDGRKYALFVIYKLSDDMQTQTDIIRFAVCKHSKRKVEAWAAVSGMGEPPQPPFCAVELLTDNMVTDDMLHVGQNYYAWVRGAPVTDDMLHVGLLADFERCMAWAWLEDAK